MVAHGLTPSTPKAIPARKRGQKEETKSAELKKKKIILIIKQIGEAHGKKRSGNKRRKFQILIIKAAPSVPNSAPQSDARFTHLSHEEPKLRRRLLTAQSTSAAATY
ncbi:hypothetical protein M0R45_009099 [Rubus argutus]|uniref:Uncharacterized protein n=1 Tax=Rubus argutus TaxID=59490 RepID=A0AAW1Y3K9_RUBAR